MDHRVTEAKSRFLLWGPALIALLFYFWSAFQYDLSKKEAREGVPVVNMFRGESIWLPKINDDRYRTKPPMFYWTGLLASKVRGKVDKISLRLPSVLAGAGTVFLTTLLGFWLYSPATGALLAGGLEGLREQSREDRNRPEPSAESLSWGPSYLER